MLGRLRKLIVLAGMVEGARRFAKANPEVTAKIAMQAIGLVDQLTKGKFHGQTEAMRRKFEGGEA